VSNQAKKLYPHDPIEELVPGLWRVTGSMALPMPRSMFVYRLHDGTLLLDSVVAMEDESMRALEALGRPRVMVVPHPKHTMDLCFYKRRYPNILVLGERDAQARVPEVIFDNTLERGLPRFGVAAHPIRGMKLHEVVLDLSLEGGGRALLFADLVNKNVGPKSLLTRLAGAPGDGGVARLLKLTQISDVDDARESLLELARLPRIALIAGCHGGVVTERCQEWLTRAGAQL